jgi:arylsulfatase A-like enzyme
VSLSAAAPVLLAIAAAACAKQEGAPPEPRAPDAAARNMVIVTLDTVRADHVGCYGWLRDTTPALDELARQCVRFTRCLAPIAQTTPSHASLFTGVLPFEHGVLSNFFSRPADEQKLLALRTTPTLRTLAQALKAKGFRTGGFVAATPVKRFTGLDSGFDAWSEPEGARRAGKDVIADAIAFIDGAAGAPFLVWVHLFDAHGPLRPPFPPQEYLERYRTDRALKAWLDERGFPETVRGEHAGETPPSTAHNLYDGALRFLDDQLSVLLRRLREPDLWERTVLVVVGDHGQGLGQHEDLNHGSCWDEQYRVPFLLRAPGLEPGTSDALGSIVDVAPTALALSPEAADETFLRQCRGRNLLAADFEPRPLFGMSPIEKGITSITTTRFKLIRRRERAPQLYDLEADPHERRDVAAEQPDVVRQLARRLDEEIERQKNSQKLHHARVTDEGTIDPKVLKELQELGYGASGEEEDDGVERGAAPAPRSPPDPKAQRDRENRARGGGESSSGGGR